MIDLPSFNTGVAERAAGIGRRTLASIYPPAPTSIPHLSVHLGYIAAALAAPSQSSPLAFLPSPAPSSDPVPALQALYARTSCLLDGMASTSFTFGATLAEEGYGAEAIMEIIASDPAIAIQAHLVSLGWTTRVEHTLAVAALRDFGISVPEKCILRRMDEADG